MRNIPNYIQLFSCRRRSKNTRENSWKGKDNSACECEQLSRIREVESQSSSGERALFFLRCSTQCIKNTIESTSIQSMTFCATYSNTTVAVRHFRRVEGGLFFSRGLHHHRFDSTNDIGIVRTFVNCKDKGVCWAIIGQHMRCSTRFTS